MAERYVAVAKTSDLPVGGTLACEAGEVEIALCNVDETIHAIENVCTHDDGTLTGGGLEGHAIVCPRHGAKFDVRSGAVLQMPAAFPVRTFPTKVDGDTIYVKVDIDE
jgi:3-phenylpropionate/trans-cinnamate dioxygenase ferredoxin subunit